MSAAAAADAPPPKGKKKLIIIIAAAVAVLGLGGGGALVMMNKKKAAAEAEAAESEDAPAKKSTAKASAKSADPKAAPVFVPLDPFTVNLADRDAERYAQVGITLELDDAKTEAIVKTYMPAIRNNILMAIGDKTAGDLMSREGKTRLAEKVRRETSRALGYEVAEPEEEDPAADDEKPAKKKRKKVEEVLPVTAVHFSNFIIQ